MTDSREGFVGGQIVSLDPRVPVTMEGVRASVDAVMERLREEVPHADNGSASVRIGKQGAAVTLQARFRIKRIDGTLGASGEITWQGHVNAEGFIDFKW